MHQTWHYRWLHCLGRKRVRECQSELCPPLRNTAGKCLEWALSPGVNFAQEKCPAQTLITLLMGTGSYDALCMSSPLLEKLGEMTASVLGLLSDYLFLAAVFSSFSWCSCYFSSSWSGGKVYVASHLPHVSARQLIVSLLVKLSRHCDVLSNAQS